MVNNLLGVQNVIGLLGLGREANLVVVVLFPVKVDVEVTVEHGLLGLELCVGLNLALRLHTITIKIQIK